MPTSVMITLIICFTLVTLAIINKNDKNNKGGR